MPLKTNSVEHALFSLRVERALRLSYAPTASARETSDYLKRLRREDVALAAYLEAIEEEDVAPEIRDELAQNAIQRCHPPDSASQENPNTATNSGDGKCIEMLDEVSSGRLQPGGESVETFYQQLEKSAGAADGAIGIVVEQVRQSQPGWWEQATLRVWLYLMGLDGLTVLTDKAEIRPVAAGELDIAAASMERLAQQRAQQMRALWALDRMAKQERLMTRHGQIAAWVTVWLALLGVGGTLLLTTAAHSVQPIRKSLTAAEQIERVVYTARRQQSSFVRRFAGTATTLLSFTFGLGLVVGAYLVVSGLFSGDVSTLLRNGAVITIISWIGRRLMQLIPADLGHGEGYLEQAAGEIQAILDKADTNKKSLYPASYFLFGHDHVPAFAVLPPLDESGAEPRMRQWYVNTGAWVQSHTGEVRFRREDEAHSIFVEIVPGPATTGEGREPQLWRWDRAVGQPNHLPHLIATHPESLSKRLMKTVLRWLGLNADYTWPR